MAGSRLLPLRARRLASLLVLAAAADSILMLRQG